MASRPNPDPEVVPLVRAIKARIDGLGAVVSSAKDGLEVYVRNKTPFLQLEMRRDHMSLDLWLPPEQLEEARASGIARAHPFLGDEAVKVRFERATDLARVARWLEASYAYAPDRTKKPPKKPVMKDGAKPIATPPPASAKNENAPIAIATKEAVPPSATEGANTKKAAPKTKAREAKPKNGASRARVAKPASKAKTKKAPAKVVRPAPAAKKTAKGSARGRGR